MSFYQHVSVAKTYRKSPCNTALHIQTYSRLYIFSFSFTRFEAAGFTGASSNKVDSNLLEGVYEIINAFFGILTFMIQFIKYRNGSFRDFFFHLLIVLAVFCDRDTMWHMFDL